MADNTLTQDYLHQIFDYKDGELIWKLTVNSCAVEGKVAGSIKKDNYKRIGLNKKVYLSHRLIFLYHNGYLPKFVDHKDKNTLNNCIENLREATKSQNCQNQKIPVTNTSGFKNVSWNKAKRKWKVDLRNNNKSVYIGLFDDIELADLVAQEARNKYHKQFATNF